MARCKLSPIFSLVINERSCASEMSRVAWRHFIKSLLKVYEISSFEVVSEHDRVSCASYLCLVDFLGKLLQKIIPITISSYKSWFVWPVGKLNKFQKSARILQNRPHFRSVRDRVENVQLSSVPLHQRND